VSLEPRVVTERTMLDSLAPLGCDLRREAVIRSHIRDGLDIGRVVRVDVDRCLVTTATETVTASAAALPVVGDWVLLGVSGTASPPRTVVEILERFSTLSRSSDDPRAVDRIVAANVDLVGIVTALDEEPNIRRLEREIVVAGSGGARPLIVLTKCDVHPDPAAAAGAVRSRIPTAEMILVSAGDELGIEALHRVVAPNLTLVLVGASGAGKSTLVNRLTRSEVMRTNAVRRRDHKGRHTTSARHLISLEGGGLLIDTPGVRAVALSTEPTGLAVAYDAIAEVASRCRFSDCRHHGEPGCAVAAAVVGGDLDRAGVARYVELSDDSARVEAARDPAERARRDRTNREAKRASRRKPRS
jgi:ribosome biogenesis GTPase / thiamine phosphate phosphatase